MWDIFWDKKYNDVRDKYACIGLNYCDPILKSNSIPSELWYEIAKAGIYQDGVEYDGVDGIVYLAAALEGLSYGLRGGRSGAIISLGTHLIMGVSMIARHTQIDIRQRLMNKVINENMLVSFAATEPHGGSDARKLETTLAKYDKGYILNGEKWNITNSPCAGVIVTFARDVVTNQPIAIAVERNWSGVSVEPLSPVGLELCPLGKISFHNVKVPPENILSNVGNGLLVMNDGFTRERLLLSFVAAGVMKRILDDAFEYAHNRTVFENVIGSYQYVKQRLTDIKLSLDTTQSLGHACLKSFIANKSVMGLASEGKMYAASQALRSVENAIKIFGSYGIQQGSVGDLLTSVMGGTIGGGTEEIHREAIYQDLYLNYRKKLRKKSTNK